MSIIICLLHILNLITDGKDYRIISTTVSVAAGEMSKSFIINIINNNIIECDETFKLEFSIISPPCEVVIGNGTSEVMIRDDNSKRNIMLVASV